MNREIAGRQPRIHPTDVIEIVGAVDRQLDVSPIFQRPEHHGRGVTAHPRRHVLAIAMHPTRVRPNGKLRSEQHRHTEDLTIGPIREAAHRRVVAGEARGIHLMERYDFSADRTTTPARIIVAAPT